MLSGLSASATVGAIVRFVAGLQCFLASIVFHAIKVLHPASSAVVALITFILWRRTHRTIGKVTDAFHLDGGDVIIAAFGDPEAPHPTHELSTASRRGPGFRWYNALLVLCSLSCLTRVVFSSQKMLKIFGDL